MDAKSIAKIRLQSESIERFILSRSPEIVNNRKGEVVQAAPGKFFKFVELAHLSCFSRGFALLL